MGNVLAASSGTSNSDTAKKLGLPDLVPEAASIPQEPPQQRENPGTYEELHKKIKEIQAVPYEGAKILLNKGLSNHFQITHTLTLGNQQPHGYRFGATYVGTKSYSPQEAFPVLLGDIDAGGNLNANIIHQFTPRLRAKCGLQFQEAAVGQVTADYKGDDYTASLTVANPNLINLSGVIVGHYLQAVTSKLALGSELLYQYGPQIPGGHIAVVSGAARYTEGNNIWSGSLGASGIHLCYYQKCSEQLQIGAEFETNLRMQEINTTLAYQVDLPKADIIFRGTFDSNWNVCGVLEKRLQPLPFTFCLSGRMNHTKNAFKVGCGIIIG